MRRLSQRRLTAASERGYTLVEVLVVLAIASILMLATVAIISVMTKQKADASRRLARVTQSYLAMTLLERQVLNAGYHFPSARFGVRFHNNVDAGTFGGIAVGPPCDEPGCIVEGTDVLETLEGTTNPMGLVVNAIPDAGGYTVFLQPPGGPVDPGDTSEHVFVFVAENGASCAAKGNLRILADGGSGSPWEINVTMLDRDFADQDNTYYSTSASAPYDFQCPAPGMAMSAGSVRRRYFVLATDAGAGLYSQEQPLLGTADGGASLLALGIDNLQVIPLAQQSDAGWSAGCTSGLCECNATGADCVMSGSNSDTDFVTSDLVVGARIGISAPGEVPARAPTTVPRLPLADEAFPNDRVYRTNQTQTYMFRNFSQVQP